VGNEGEAGCWILDIGHCECGVRGKMLDTGHCERSEAGSSWMLDTDYSIFEYSNSEVVND
jgi:hypothetical protein